MGHLGSHASFDFRTQQVLRRSVAGFSCVICGDFEICALEPAVPKEARLVEVHGLEAPVIQSLKGSVAAPRSGYPDGRRPTVGTTQKSKYANISVVAVPTGTTFSESSTST
jgi:hypothetical protein